MINEKFNKETQKLFLYMLINDHDIFSRCLSIIKKEYFHQDFRKTIEFIINYSNTYKKSPPKELITAQTGFKFNDEPNLTDLLALKDWFLDIFEEFIKYQALSKVILESADKINKGDYENIEKNVKEALSISLDKNLGTDYFENPKERLERLRDRTNIVTTGWKSVDKKLFGGFGRGQVNIFAGNSGTGKSLFLQNLSLNWAQLGLNIIYLTLELSEELVALRFDAMLTENPTSQIMSNIESFDHIIKRKKHDKNFGEMRIKYMPPGTTSNQIYGFLKEFQIQTGLKPDALIVDYLDLMHPNDKNTSRSDLFIKDKYVTEELRALVVDMNLLCCTASQLNRSAVEENEHNMSHIAGGISKVNTADNVMTIYSTPVMKANGSYRIHFIKTRSSSGVGSSVDLKYNPSCMRITDVDEEKEEMKNTSDEKEKSSISKSPKEILAKLNKGLKLC